MFTISAGFVLLFAVAGIVDLLRSPALVTAKSASVVVLAVCVALVFAYVAHLRGE